jgi:Uma2 family endonuclease
VTTEEYLYETEETTRRRELVASVVREPPAPYFSHQQLVLKVAGELSDYVEQRDLGVVAVAPVDVVLDRENNLVLQPDVLFVAANRLSIIRYQVWGPPDLVVEVHSESTRLYDRGEKLRLYRQYGVRECWLVDLYGNAVMVMDYTGAIPMQRESIGPDPILSTVLPDLQLTVHDIFLEKRRPRYR